MKRSDLNPKTILDLGCDNGITTCFFAMIFPEAEVIGIDINESAVSCANKLKENLNIHNVDYGSKNIYNELIKRTNYALKFIIAYENKATQLLK